MLNEFAKVYLATLSGKDQSVRSAILKSYLDMAPDNDKRMAIQLLNGYKSIVQVKRPELTQWLLEYKDLPDWLIRESHAVTGDWAETFTLIIGNPTIPASGFSLSGFVTQLLETKPTKKELREWVESMWSALSPEELLLFHKLILGSFKSIKEKNYLAVFLTTYYQADLPLVSLRLSTYSAHQESFSSLVDPDWDPDEKSAKPYPFIEPQLLEPDVHGLGSVRDWYAEPFLPGQRVQLIFRNQEIYTWTPEFMLLPPGLFPFFQGLQSLPAGIVLDGIIQKKTEEQGSKTPVEIRFHVLDILEWEFEDLRNTPLDQRKRLVEKITREINRPDFLPVPLHEFAYWEEVRPGFYPDGWVIKRKDGGYHPGKDHWLRLKSAKKQLYTILMYTEALPHQNQVYLCTFGIFNDQQELVPIVKLSSDQLGEAQMTQLHYWIQNNGIQKFGPVRVVRPQLVFLIAYDKSIKNLRLKAGFTLKNAQIDRWESKPGPEHKIGSTEELKDQI